ncbi:MAG TPA: hypothetical protein VHY48_07910 [Acidobacteriaceae bacterium]|jgi:hypothetical protein|nr:hypothetical protein [Acidobacteriaceae bacterium]
MRLKLILCGAMLPPALILAGCGMGTVSSVSMNVDSPALSGQAYGGQQPISGAYIAVVAMGTTGYGSQGTVLATTTTDANGNFSFVHGAYTCSQSDEPVYIMAIGGDAGYGTNLSIANAASLGTCANSLTSYVTINEVSTTALAFSLAHYFTTTIGGTNPFTLDGDWFGGPSSITGGVTTYSKGLELGNSYTIPAMVDTASGQVAAPATGETIESQKIYTIANILADCVNSDGSTKNGQPCQELFKYTTIGTTTPTDTLQAAVELALSEYSISAPGQGSSTVSNLFQLQGSTPAFGGGLTSQPNDFTIGISYTSSSFGLGVAAGIASTLDIDASNKIWFPSNASGEVGAGYFDQTTRSFNGPYNGTAPSTLLFPEQVAIDQSGYAWYNDVGSSNVLGFLESSPSTIQAFSLTLSTSNALTIGKDNKVNVGITGAGNNYELANINAARTSYTVESGTSGAFAYPMTSIAADNVLDDGVATTLAGSTALDDYFVTSTPAVNSEITSSKDDSGQVIYVGRNPLNSAWPHDFIATRPFSSSANGTIANDGLCIFSIGGKCKNIKGGNTNSPVGIAIDGAKNLWLPESADAGLLEITPTGTGNNSPYLNSGGGVPNSEYLHGSGYGGTLTTPYGVAIDNEGNVWISNAGCTTAPFCVPGSFTLTEIIGVAAPTITPVSAQVAGGAALTGTEPTY